MKNIKIKKIYIFIVAIILFSIEVVYAVDSYLADASQVSFQPGNLTSTNVQDAIDELYNAELGQIYFFKKFYNSQSEVMKKSLVYGKYVSTNDGLEPYLCMRVYPNYNEHSDYCSSLNNMTINSSQFTSDLGFSCGGGSTGWGCSGKVGPSQTYYSVGVTRDSNSGKYTSLTFLERNSTNTEEKQCTINGSNVSCVVNEIEQPICKAATSLHTSGNTSYGKIKSTTETVGTAYDCDVNKDGIYDAEEERFYFISDYYDFSNSNYNSNYAVLIYYKNVDNARYLSSLSSDADVTFIDSLPSSTNWKNVSLVSTSRIIFDSNLSGRLPYVYYGTVSLDGKAARLATYKELSGCLGNDNTIISNCNFLLENQGEYKAVWLETFSASNNQEALSIDQTSNKILSRSMNYYGGIRPVIEVEKSKMN